MPEVYSFRGNIFFSPSKSQFTQARPFKDNQGLTGHESEKKHSQFRTMWSKSRGASWVTGEPALKAMSSGKAVWGGS